MIMSNLIHWHILYNEIRDYTLLSPDRMVNLHYLAERCKDIKGEILEMGVYKGGSALMIAHATGRPVHLFDSFEGLPDIHQNDGQSHKRGEFAATEDIAQGLFDKYNYQCIIHKGFIPVSLDEKIKKVAFAHVDLDLYQSMVDAIDYLKPRMARGGIILFDDYNEPSCAGATKAIEEKFEVFVDLSSPQAYVEF